MVPAARQAPADLPVVRPAATDPVDLLVAGTAATVHQAHRVPMDRAAHQVPPVPMGQVALPAAGTAVMAQVALQAPTAAVALRVW